MASSDDEGETVQNIVSDYKFIDGGADEELISFADLPVVWSKGETHDGKETQIYLRGKADNGLRPIYVQVTAWKFVLPKENPEISVLSVQGTWIKLLKPWNPFNDIIRTILVTLHFLHFAKWNPLRPERALWDTLNKNFRFERGPCVDDLANHVPLITETIKWDEKLAESKLLSALLAEKPWERRNFNEDVKPPFIVDDVNEKEDVGEPDKADEDSNSEEGGEADENEDSVCAICDNGGDIIICDGKCMRSFHKTIEDGEDSACDSLGLTAAELEAIKNVPFICDNCKYKKHQCFVCGKLGSSDELSNPEVICCVNGACGYFYHPQCVARIFHPGDNAAAEELQNKIAAGEPLTCPIHRCHVCNEVEMSSIDDMQFAVCRRCPKAYHRKCLPSEIAFEDNENGLIQRAWEGLIPKRLLIYCLDHEIDEDLLTPSRDHLKFPGPRQENRKMRNLEYNRNKNMSAGRVLASGNDAGNRISSKKQQLNDKVRSNSRGGGLSIKRLEELPVCSSNKRQKLASTRDSREKLREFTTGEGALSSVYGSYDAFRGTDSELVKSSKVLTKHGEVETTRVNPTENRTATICTLDADARRRVLTLMKDAKSSVTLEEVKKRHKPPSTHTQYSRFSTDSITFGKVQGSIQAVRAALKKLDGGSVQDAKAVCGEELLEQVLKWKDKLKVYLAPFLHGTRYTSFGRHFTKMDKLKEIVELLHWYVQDGDMLVDFCCGSNDFSCLMKKKLDEMGKICLFKNYDILQAKNDFNFERRDWMKVRTGELPDGSKLIMGLNPPFGLNAALANKFIDKALEFKPKLLILIVPRETQRLDEKIPPYDLIWDDDQMLAGKSFYLPGSVDVNDKQMEDWNTSAPVLYLWSDPLWTLKHRAIADEHGHIAGAISSHRLDESHNELIAPNSAPVAFENEPSIGGEAKHADTHNNLDQKSKEIISHEKDLLCDINGSGVGKNNSTVKNYSESSSKNSGGNGSKKRSPSNVVLKDNSSSKRLSVSRHGPLDVANKENYRTGRLETPREVHSGRGNYGQLNVANQTECVEAPPHFDYERGDYRLLNQSNLSPFQTEHNGRDGVNDFSTCQNHVESSRQGRSERSEYHHQRDHHHQQFNHSSISAYPSYSQSEGNENDEMSDVLSKYLGGSHGMQPYNPRHNQDQSFGNRRMGSPFESMYEPNLNVHGIPGFGQPIGMGSPYGGVHHNEGTTYPPPPPPPPRPPHYGYGENIYGQRSSGSVMHRYASRLDELGAEHGPMQRGGHLPIGPQHTHPPPPPHPHQGSLGFVPPPSHPSYNHSSGWLKEE